MWNEGRAVGKRTSVITRMISSLLSGGIGPGSDHDAGDDVKAKADGERDEHGVCRKKKFDFPRWYVRAMLLDAEEPSLSSHGTTEKTSAAHLSNH